MKFILYARNREDRREFTKLKSSNDKFELFDYAYGFIFSLYAKGGWLIEVECTTTGQLVEDERILDLA